MAGVGRSSNGLRTWLHNVSKHKPCTPSGYCWRPPHGWIGNQTVESGVCASQRRGLRSEPSGNPVERNRTTMTHRKCSGYSKARTLARRAQRDIKWFFKGVKRG